MKRSEFIRMVSIAAGGAMLGAHCSQPKKKIPGQLLSSGSSVAHLLRSGKFPEPSETQKVQVLVAGSGVAGLSAMRMFRHNNIDNVLLLELDDHIGGNSASGKNSISAYPWGAHYLPMPSAEYPELLSFLQEAGILKSYDEKGKPVFDDESLCFDPHERLYINYHWQDDLVPAYAIPQKEADEIGRFHDMMHAFRLSKGSDGKQAFAIPIDHSSSDEQFTAYDKITMKQWMDQQSLKSEHLRWYVNYCCRDDYGAPYSEVSAWAGIHYFASRRHILSGDGDDTVLTWPEGNARLVQHLENAAGKNKIRTGALVYRAGTENGKPYVLYYDVKQQKSIRVDAEKMLLALPHFVTSRLIKNIEGAFTDQQLFTYSPWMVANISVSDWSKEHGQELSWDNVIYGTDNIGYVDACHQHLQRLQRERVFTYYQPLDQHPPAEARKQASARTHEEWVQQIISGLSSAHPHAADYITNIDVWLWGHGMIRPVPGFITGEGRRRAQQPLEAGFHFAHSDQSGISIFEEAFFQGHRAALEIIEALKNQA